ncbi:MAG: hypothetical protein QM564_05180 [Bergeyella sp.]
MNKIISGCLALLTLFSCNSLKYDISENKGDFSQIRAGERYVVHSVNNERQKIDVSAVKRDSITGTFRNQNIVALRYCVIKP